MSTRASVAKDKRQQIGKLRLKQQAAGDAKTVDADGGEEEGEGDDEPEALELHGESVGTREGLVKDTKGAQKATP